MDLRSVLGFACSRPDFLILGGQRCGTSSLFRHLCDHPHFLPPVRKELHFFDLRFERGRLWYRRQFPGRWAVWRRGRRVQGRVVTGEATPYYLFHPWVPRRVRQRFPEVRLITLLRNPVDRAYSQYLHTYPDAQSRPTFEAALDEEARRLPREQGMLAGDPYGRSRFHQQCSFVARGRYAEQLEAWMAHFPRQQFLILSSERFFEDPVPTLARVCRFLQIPPLIPARSHRANASAEPPLSGALRCRLADEFRPHNQRLYELLGEDLGWDNG